MTSAILIGFGTASLPLSSSFEFSAVFGEPIEDSAAAGVILGGGASFEPSAEVNCKRDLCTLDLGVVTIFSCGEALVPPDEGLSVTIAAEDTDGGALCSSAVHLVSRGRYGEGFLGTACEAIPVLAGNYALGVGATGLPDVAQDVTVDEDGTVVGVTVEASETLVWDITFQVFEADDPPEDPEDTVQCSVSAPIPFGGSAQFRCDLDDDEVFLRTTLRATLTKSEFRFEGEGTVVFQDDPDLTCDFEVWGKAGVVESATEYTASGSISGIFECSDNDQGNVVGDFSASAAKP